MHSDLATRRALGVDRLWFPSLRGPLLIDANGCMGQVQGPTQLRNPMCRATRHFLPPALAAELACGIHGKVLGSKRV